MSRIAPKFAELQAQGRKALIPFVTAGYPYADVTPELMHAMVAGGADVIELGVPFSDPSADGPVIQKAGDKALAFGIGLVQVLAMVREFRKGDNATPPWPVLTACWWWTTRPKNARTSRPRSKPTAWT